jgi:hypothetical protein
MKNTRFITAIVAFAVTFIFSAGLVRIIFGEPQVSSVYFNRPQCSKRYVAGIESFVLQDNRNGEVRIGKIKRQFDSEGNYYAAYADAVMEYSNVSSSMDANRFPQDFQDAWHTHMDAWRNYAEYLQDMKNTSVQEDSDIDEIKNAETRYNSEINRTWMEVLRVGRSYGMNPSIR